LRGEDGFIYSLPLEAGLSHMSEELCEEGIIPSGAF